MPRWPRRPAKSASGSTSKPAARSSASPACAPATAKPFIAETIALPAKLFPGLVDLPVIPNTLYDLFQKSYGILMMRTDDRLTAVVADAEAAAKLAVAPGTPLLRIDRIAYALDERPIEWRVSLCHLENAHYIARTKLSHDSGGR